MLLLFCVHTVHIFFKHVNCEDICARSANEQQHSEIITISIKSWTLEICLTAMLELTAMLGYGLSATDVGMDKEPAKVFIDSCSSSNLIFKFCFCVTRPKCKHVDAISNETHFMTSLGSYRCVSLVFIATHIVIDCCFVEWFYARPETMCGCQWISMKLKGCFHMSDVVASATCGENAKESEKCPCRCRALVIRRRREKTNGKQTK